MLPAHIDFIVSAPDHKPIITQLFGRRDKHINYNSVFAVKESLAVDFLPRGGDPVASFELPYDFRLAAFEEAKDCPLAGTTDESASFGAVLGDADALPKYRGTHEQSEIAYFGCLSM